MSDEDGVVNLGEAGGSDELLSMLAGVSVQGKVVGQVAGEEGHRDREREEHQSFVEADVFGLDGDKPGEEQHGREGVEGRVGAGEAFGPRGEFGEGVEPVVPLVRIHGGGVYCGQITGQQRPQ